MGIDQEDVHRTGPEGKRMETNDGACRWREKIDGPGDLRDRGFGMLVFRTLLFAGLLVLTGWGSAPLPAQTPGTLLRGVVLDRATGGPVPGAQVVVRDRQGTTVRAGYSGAEGQFRFSGVSPGEYSVEVGRIGFARGVETAVRLIEGGEVLLEFHLRAVALMTDAVVVTAGRRVERVADSDVSVAVVGRERIREAREPTVFGTLARVGGVDVFEAGLGHQQVSARGFVNPFSTNLLILIDHRLAALPGLMTLLPGMVTAAQEDMERVEVVIGPSSALYGPNAGNGVVNIVTRGPLEGQGQSLRVTGGERGFLRAAGRSAGPLTDRLAYSVTAEVQRVRDFPRVNTFFGADSHSIQDEPDFDVRHRILTGALHFEPSPGRRFIYSGGVTEADYINLTVVSRLQVQGWQTSYHQLRAHLDDFLGTGSLFVQGYRTRNDAGDSHYLDLLARLQIPQEFGGPGLPPEVARERATFVDRADRFDLEFQHVASLGEAHTLTTGAQWRRTRPDSDGTYLSDGPDGGPIRFYETGVYAGYENTRVPGLRLTLIGRYDHHEDVGSRFSPKFGASWSVQEGHTVRGSYSRAFNSPVTFLLYAQSFVGMTSTGLPIMLRGNRDGFRFVNLDGGPVPAPIPPLEPLNVESYEIGYRGVFRNRFVLDAAAYRTVYWNYISKEATVSRPGPPGEGVFVVDPVTGEPRTELTLTYLNYGQLPVLGFDFRSQWLVSERWTLSGAVSHQSPGTFRRGLEGLDPPAFNAPRRTYRAGLDWRGWHGPGSHLALTGRRVEEHEFESNLPYLTGTVPTYHVVDLSAGIPVPVPLAGSARLDLSVKNLLDNRHFQIPGGAELGRLASISLALEW
jgi:outer membrane receptor for ferrienterochelin and colicins